MPLYGIVLHADALCSYLAQCHGMHAHTTQPCCYIYVRRYTYINDIHHIFIWRVLCIFPVDDYKNLPHKR